MKAMGIKKVSRFPFPTPPDAQGIRAATALLTNLGAIDTGGAGVETEDGAATAIGKALALLPVGARYAKMLLLAMQGCVLEHSVALVAMLTEGDCFVRPNASTVVVEGGNAGEGEGGGEEHGGEGVVDGTDSVEMRRRRAQWVHPDSDALARLKAAGAYGHATAGGTAVGGADFCKENLLHSPTMDRALRLRQQLSRLLTLRFGSEPGWVEFGVDGNLRPPTRKQSTLLKQVLLSGLLDCVAKRAPAGTVTEGNRLRRSCAYLSCNEAVKEPLYIKSTSTLFSRDPEELPQWVVYQDIVRGEREGSPAYMVCVTAIDPAWITPLAEGSPLLRLSGPLPSPPPTYDPVRGEVMCRVTPRYGVHGWPLAPYPVGLAQATAVATGTNAILGAGTREGSSGVPDTVYRWFGRLLLEGKVEGTLVELRVGGFLNDPPALLTLERPAGKVSALLSGLRQARICGLPGLREKWRHDPSFLKDAVRLWVRSEGRPVFEKAWRVAIATAQELH
ncbi:unnamed protein product [Choristocarpus tenellus]